MTILAIHVSGLTYSHRTGSTPALVSLQFDLHRGSRTILIGANGAGKSTLLHILAGKRLVSTQGAIVHVLGKDVFRDFPTGVTFLGTEWAMNPVVRGDISVLDFLNSVGGYRHKERRDKLLDLLDVDLDWHMHEISDGERRRVQLCMGLMAPWDVLLLDEITTDLDVLVRTDLLSFLKNDSETRNATIVYATHIYDGVDEFPTHVAHMRFGSLVVPPMPWSIPSSSLHLHQLALEWLREDRKIRHELERQGVIVKSRGSKKDEAVPSDSETFYKKYDYSH